MHLERGTFLCLVRGTGRRTKNQTTTTKNNAVFTLVHAWPNKQNYKQKQKTVRKKVKKRTNVDDVENVFRVGCNARTVHPRIVIEMEKNGM